MANTFVSDCVLPDTPACKEVSTSDLLFQVIHGLQNFPINIGNRPQRWIVTIPSFNQWLQTIENHRHSIGTNGCHTKKPLPFH